MTKKVIAALMVLAVLCTLVFAGCGKNEYENPADGNEYELVTDENGQKVLSEDGELIVYAKDENGKYIIDENGEKVTNVQAFIGAIEEGNKVEDYAYIVEMPEGWKYEDGEFIDSATGIFAKIGIEKSSYADYYKTNEYIRDELAKQDVDCKWTEDIAIPNADGVEGVKLFFNKDNVCAEFIFFETNGNVFSIIVSSDKEENAAKLDAELDAFLKCITYKPYRYYDEDEIVTRSDNVTEAPDDAVTDEVTEETVSEDVAEVGGVEGPEEVVSEAVEDVDSAEAA